MKPFTTAFFSVALVGLLLVVGVLLGEFFRPVPVPTELGGNFTDELNPKVFHNTVELKGEVTLSNCGTATWNPGESHSTSTPTSTVTVTGAAAGDVCLASLSTATGTTLTGYGFIIGCSITSSTTAVVSVVHPSTDILDFATGTVTACYFN